MRQRRRRGVKSNVMQPRGRFEPSCAGSSAKEFIGTPEKSWAWARDKHDDRPPPEVLVEPEAGGGWRRRLARNRLAAYTTIYCLSLELPFQRYAFGLTLSLFLAWLRFLAISWILIKLLIVVSLSECEFAQWRGYLYDWTVFYPPARRISVVRSYVGMCIFHVCLKISVFYHKRKTFDASLVDYLCREPPAYTNFDYCETMQHDELANGTGTPVPGSPAPSLPSGHSGGQRTGALVARLSCKAAAAAAAAASAQVEAEVEAEEERALGRLLGALDQRVELSEGEQRRQRNLLLKTSCAYLRDRAHWFALSDKLWTSFRLTLLVVLLVCSPVVLMANRRLGFTYTKERQCDIEKPLLRLVGLVELNYAFFECLNTLLGSFSYCIMVKNDLLLQAARVECYLSGLMADIWRNLPHGNCNDGHGDDHDYGNGRAELPTRALVMRQREAEAELNWIKFELDDYDDDDGASDNLTKKLAPFGGSGGGARQHYGNNLNLDQLIRRAPQPTPRHKLAASCEPGRLYQRRADVAHLHAELPAAGNSLSRARTYWQPASGAREPRPPIYAPDLNSLNSPPVFLQNSAAAQLLPQLGGYGGGGAPLECLRSPLEERNYRATCKRLTGNMMEAQNKVILFLRCIDSHKPAISFVGNALLFWMLTGLSFVPLLVFSAHKDASERRGKLIYALTCSISMSIGFMFTLLGAMVHKRAISLTGALFRLCSLFHSCAVAVRWNKILMIWFCPSRCAFKVSGIFELTYLSLLKAISILISGFTLVLNYSS